jgi:GAF domain-containing protein/HAMP domain-containing protein
MSERKLPIHARSRSLGTTLTVSFLAVALLPMLVTGLVLFISTAQSTSKQAGAQLAAVARFKEATLHNWTAGLKYELNAVLLEETGSRYARTLLTANQDGPSFQVAYDRLLRRFRQVVSEEHSFSQLLLLNSRGIVILSDSVQQRGSSVQQEYFFNGLAGPYVQPVTRLQSGEVVVMVSQPVFSDSGDVIGVLAAKANVSLLYHLLREQTGSGATGQSFLLLPDFSLLHADASTAPAAEVALAQAALTSKSEGSGSYTNHLGVEVIGAHLWLPELGAALLIEQDQAEAMAVTRSMLGVYAVVALASLLAAFLVSLVISSHIARPVSYLAQTAARFAAGDLEAPTLTERGDEIGRLGQALNIMSDQIRSLVTGLESRVQERTAELEKRNALLEASTQVGQAVFTIRDQSRLIQQAVGLIQKHFGLYYVGLFLLDETKEWAVLKSGTGEAGKAMLDRGHRLKVAGASMIGWAVANAQARIALQAGEDPIRLATPELPDTRSEAAVPLRVRGNAIGALTIQSDQPGAFDDTSIALLQTMADQLAAALENARLYSERQAALEAERQAYSQVSRSAWQTALTDHAGITYRGTERGLATSLPAWRPEFNTAIETGASVESALVLAPETSSRSYAQITRPTGAAASEADIQHRAAITIPIKVRGTVIGLLDTYKPAHSSGWTRDEIALLETVSEQLGVALESARLYQETQNRAERERMVAEVTARMRESLDLETVLQTAVREVGQTLGLAEVSVLLTREGAALGNGSGEPG